MRTYNVRYTMHEADLDRSIDVLANSKAEAYDKAVYELIPEKEKSCPYSAWVQSVTYNNGSYKVFNTFEGNPY